MKLSGLILFTTVLILSHTRSARAAHREHRRKLSKGSKGTFPQDLQEGECAICTPGNKVRPTELTLQYIPGQGKISAYQDARKATCRDQVFPKFPTTVRAYGEEYDVNGENRGIFRVVNSRFDSETDFFFTNGFDCYIHTSCSQPLVAGDQIGPFLILAGNDCTFNAEPSCGDGNVDPGEDCDPPDQSTGCRADCTLCRCEASATYDSGSGAVTIDFEMCGQEPLKSDFIGIYPCDAKTVTIGETWCEMVLPQHNSKTTCSEVGIEIGEKYVMEKYVWFTYTCGAPEDGGCQEVGSTTTWPDSGSIFVDPNVNGANWAFPGGRELAPGCYKVLLNREVSNKISPPPFPTICADWESALEFEVPNSRNRL